MTEWVIEPVEQSGEFKKITSLYFNTDVKTRKRQHAPHRDKTISKIKSPIRMGATITWGPLLICNAEAAFDRRAFIHLTHTENWSSQL